MVVVVGALVVVAPVVDGGVVIVDGNTAIAVSSVVVVGNVDVVDEEAARAAAGADVSDVLETDGGLTKAASEVSDPAAAHADSTRAVAASIIKVFKSSPRCILNAIGQGDARLDVEGSRLTGQEAPTPATDVPIGGIEVSPGKASVALRSRVPGQVG